MRDPYDRLIPYVADALNITASELATAFRPATESDIPAILALRRAVIPSVWWDDEAFVRWRYFRRMTSDGAVPFWVFIRRGTLIGVCGLEPVTLVVDGAPTDAVRTLDIMVHPANDGLGLGAYMNLALFRRFPITIVTGSNDRSHQLLSRLFDHAADLVTWKTVTASRDLVGERLRSPAVSVILSNALDAWLALRRRARRHPVPDGVQIREIDRFDAAVTALSLRCERPGRVLVRRSADYVNWRFFDNPRCEYRALAACTSSGLAGYVVFKYNRARPNPRAEGEIVDWLAAGEPDAAAAVLRPLFAHAIDALVRNGARLVSCAAAGTDVAPVARANGLRERRAERLPFFVRASEKDVHTRLVSGRGLLLTRGDLDVE